MNVGLIGGNGAGKSTLLRLIAGMDTPDRGEVIRHSRVSWPIGLSGGMQGNMTGRQNVKFVARVQGKGSFDVKNIINFVQDFAEIGDAFDEPVNTYSSGMKSRISFGLSLAFNFDVYISDEATSVGDRAFKAKAQDLFKKQIGKSSLIMVSHGEGILRDLCQAGIYLKKGSAHWYDDINEAIVDYHSDSDERSIVEGLFASDNLKIGKDFNEDQERALSEELKRSKATSSGLVFLIKHAKSLGWADEDLEVVRRANKYVTSRVSDLSRIVKETRAGVIRRERIELKKTEKAVQSIEYALKLAEEKDWSDKEYEILLKVKKMAHAFKVDKERRIEEINGES